MKKVAVVTGGFGGIGYGIARALDANGYAVVILSRSADSDENKQKLADLVTEDKLAITCDISNTQDIAAAREQVLKTFGSIDVLVNCAGFTQPIPHNDLQTLTEDLFDKITAINLRGTYSMIKAFTPYFKDDSVIVNISSASAQRRGGSNLAYAASKAGVESLTRNFALLMAPRTRVVGISPGYVDSTGPNSPKAREVAVATTPMGRVAMISDVVDTVMFAINSKFVTGNNILVDGGRGI
jgi:3-oxoacyl-[acyl-carrier protein] reductase